MSSSTQPDAAGRRPDGAATAAAGGSPRLDGRQVDGLLGGTLGNPHAFLGLHPAVAAGGAGAGLQARVYAPTAERVTLVEQGGQRARVPLERAHDAGIFAATIAGRGEVFPYLLEM